jgi:uncharacterized delta-60 repeat protein
MTDFNDANDEGRALVIQANNRIVLAGWASPPKLDRNYDFGLTRYRAGGKLDLTFSGDGKVRTHFGTNHQDYANDVALQADGRIVVAGSVTRTVNGYDFGLARYLAE